MRLPACYRYPAIEFHCPTCCAKPGIECYATSVDDEEFRGTHKARDTAAQRYGEDLYRKDQRKAS